MLKKIKWCQMIATPGWERHRADILNLWHVFPKGSSVRWTEEEGLHKNDTECLSLLRTSKQAQLTRCPWVCSELRGERPPLITSPPPYKGQKTQLIKNSNLNSILKMEPISLNIHHLLLTLFITSCKSYITGTYDLNFVYWIFLYIRISFCAL